MSKRLGAVMTALLIICTTVLFLEQAVNAELILQQTQDGYVLSFEALQSRLDKNDAVTLGANITIPHGKSILLNDTIHTGSYGILVEGELELGSGAAVTGVGALQPVVEISSGGSLYIAYSDFESAPSIEATGNCGKALVLREGGVYDQFRVLPSFLYVTASGMGSIAMESEIPLDLQHHFIEANDGTGIVCDKEVKLFLCKVSAGVSSIIAPGYTFDTCNISPAATMNGTEISRKITRLDSGAYPNRDCVALGDPLPHYINSSGYTGPFTAALSAEGYDDVFEDIYVMLNAPNIGTDEIGSYPVEICPEEWMLPFDLVPEDAELYHIEVFDARIPYYKDTFSYWGTYYLRYWYRADDLSALTIWRSDDEGASWYDYTSASETNFDGEILTLCFSEIPEHPVWFVLEAYGFGESNILRVTWDEADNYGGDRTGGDHGVNELPEVTPGKETQTTPPIPMPGNGTPTPTHISTPTMTHAPTPIPTPSPTHTPTPMPTPSPTHMQIPMPTPKSALTQSATADAGAPEINAENIPLSDAPQAEANEGSKNPTNKNATDEASEASKNPTSNEVRSPLLQSENSEPPVKATTVPTPSPVKQTENSEVNSITVSRARLDVMMEANPKYVFFMLGDLRVSIPTDFLKGLEDLETFTVTLYQPNAQSFTVYFAVNRKELTQSFEDPFIISLPWRSGAVSCISENGESTDAALDGRQATFLLHETGTYTMAEQAVPAVAITDNAPLHSDPAPTTAEPAPPQYIEIAETPEPHSDSVIPVVIVGSVGLLCAGAYLWFSRLKQVKLQ